MLTGGETVFRGNRVGASVLLAVGVGFASLTVLAVTNLAVDAAIVPAIVAVGCLLLGGWILTCRVTLDQLGITYRSVMGEMQMRWVDVEKMYYQATKESVNLIPVGTYYRYKLVDCNGRKIKFGSRIGHGAKLAELLVKMTYPHVFDRCAARYNAGSEVDLGDIRLSRQNGIRVKRLLGWKHIPLSEVAEYRIDRGHFYIFRMGERRTSGPAIWNVPNAFVLVALLDSIYRPQTEAANSLWCK